MDREMSPSGQWGALALREFEVGTAQEISYDSRLIIISEINWNV